MLPSAPGIKSAKHGFPQGDLLFAETKAFALDCIQSNGQTSKTPFVLIPHFTHWLLIPRSYSIQKTCKLVIISPKSLPSLSWGR